MAKKFAVRSTSASRRIFAKKAGESFQSLRRQFIMRGGGYL